MINLDNTLRSLEIVLFGAVATNELPFTVSFTETSSIVSAPAGVQNEKQPVTNHGLTNGTTPVTIVAAPADATQRQVSFISVRNTDTTLATVTFRYLDGATPRTITRISLQPNDSIIFTADSGFQVIDSNGALKTISPIERGTRLVGPTLLGTVNAVLYTTPVLTQTTIKSIIATNSNAAVRRFTVTIAGSGAGFGIVDNFALAGNDILFVQEPFIVLNPGDTIEGFQAVAGGVTLTISGTEVFIG